MDGSGMMMLAGGAMVLGFFSLLMWLAIRFEQRKVEYRHAERLTAMQRGIPLQDAEVTRCRVLGWIGATVPVASLSVAVGATALLVPPRTTEPSVGALVAVWAACGVAAGCGIIAAILRLRNASGCSRVGESSGIAVDESSGTDSGV